MHLQFSLFAAITLANRVAATAEPSSSPSISSVPSSQPSETPSTQPSSIPSAQPSSMPSESPSSQPSSMPSESPSSIPSSMPSETPSSMPSESPSSQPSSMPSESPSSMPSESPSSQPSSMPSSMPSCTPTESPTPPEETFLFYPDWSNGGDGCLNDGNEPDYMAVNPGAYMSSTLDKCCTTYFGWNYDGCMGLLDDTCARELWYPDWEGDNVGCLRDGEEPYYMTANSMAYLFSSRADCCSEHYEWNYDDCVGAAATTSGLYYPDWTSGDNVCKNDGNAPDYMVKNPSYWLHSTLTPCCEANFAWNLEECTGTTETLTSGLYFPDWEGTNTGCLNDGTQPDYMSKNPDMWMHATLAECCDENYSWDLSTCLGGAAATGTSKWFMDYDANKCVQDCVGASPCGGLAESWDLLYDSQSSCCDERNWWNADCDA
jgi:hypothetical protein